jgi:DNA repair exonuclease SbcCD ATPase subunit
MRTSQALVLALTTALAFGCTSATAQEGQDKSVLAPPDGQGDPGAAEKRERTRVAEDRIREAEKRAVEAKTRLGQLTEAEKKGPDDPAVAAATADLKKALMELERARAEAGRHDPLSAERKEQARAAHERVRAAEARAADAKARLAQVVEVEKKGPDDPAVAEAKKAFEESMRALEAARADADAFAPHGGPGPFRGKRAKVAPGRGPGGPGMPPDHKGPRGRMGGFEGGPGPSVEERLAQLERAVREMHAMFERHQVGPEMRQRAEIEMRARALGGPDTRPMHPPQPMGPGAPGGAGAPGGPPPAPRPPMARPGDRAIDMRAQIEARFEETRKQMEVAEQRIADLSRQLADTQAALKKAQEELETLRAKK